MIKYIAKDLDPLDTQHLVSWILDPGFNGKNTNHNLLKNNWAIIKNNILSEWLIAFQHKNMRKTENKNFSFVYQKKYLFPGSELFY